MFGVDNTRCCYWICGFLFCLAPQCQIFGEGKVCSETMDQYALEMLDGNGYVYHSKATSVTFLCLMIQPKIISCTFTRPVLDSWMSTLGMTLPFFFLTPTDFSGPMRYKRP